MPRLTISDVAHQTQLRPSAIRYYERLGILPAPERISGRRRYDRSALYRLAVVQRARQAGFTLDEIRVLFFGFQEGTRAEARWRKLADRKLSELEALAAQISSIQTLLKLLKTSCHCQTLELCGKEILERGIAEVQGPAFAIAPRKRRNSR